MTNRFSFACLPLQMFVTNDRQIDDGEKEEE